MNEIKVNRYLDHAVIKPETSINEAIEAIKMGISHNVKTVCVRPSEIDIAIELCRGTETGVSCILGFPHGVVPSEIKREEAKLYVAKGVHEIDMVVNYGFIKSGTWDLVKQDIEVVADITKPANVILKVIFETAMLTLDEVDRATEIAILAKADFVKTSTGFYGEGATKEVVDVMLKAAKGRIMVKASGGIKNIETAKMYIKMGCHRLGVGSTATPALCGDAAVESGKEEVY